MMKSRGLCQTVSFRTWILLSKSQGIFDTTGTVTIGDGDAV